jgi:hypothetical protein
LCSSYSVKRFAAIADKHHWKITHLYDILRNNRSLPFR